MNKLIHHIVVVILLATSVVNGQHSFNGSILDSNKQPLQAVEIFNHNTNQLTVSKEDGSFEFTNLEPDSYTFTLFADAYETIIDTINIQADVKRTYTMSPLSIDLTSIDIIAKREELFVIRQLNDIEGTSIFAGKKTEVVITNLIKGNVAVNKGRQVYAQVAGLNIYEGSDGGLQLNLGGRGLDPNRTSNFNTRQNGYDISADVLGYPENYYTPPTEAIEEIRIVRGASSLQYGTQFGGLIDFRLRKIPSFEKFSITTNQTFGSYNSFSSFNAIGFNKGKFSINSFYNFKRGDGYRTNSNYKANNFYFSIDYNFNEKTKLSSEFTYFKYLAKQAGGLTDQQFEETPRLSTRDRNWFEVDWKLYNINLSHKLNAATTFTVNLFALDASRKSVGYRGNPIDLNENPITSLDEKDVNGNYILPRDLILGDFNNHGAEIRSLSKYRLFEKNAVFLAGTKYYNSKNKSIQGPGSISEDPDFELQTNLFPNYPSQSDFTFPNLNIALFSENIFYLSEKLSITPGIRIEYIKTESQGIFNQVVFDNAGNPIANELQNDDKVLRRNFSLLGLGISYKKSNALHLIANISQNYRSVTFSDIRVVSPTFIVDPNIRDERGLTADFGLKGRIKKHLSYDFTLYSVLYDDRIGIVLDDRANRVRKNIGQAIIGGSETLVNLNLARLITPDERTYKLNLFANLAFTYSQYLESEISNVEGKQVEFIPKANIKSGINIGYKNLDLSYQFTYLSKQFTDVQNSGVTEAGDKRSGVIGPIPGYNISDLSFSYKAKYFTIKGGVNNLFDKSYFTRRATGYPGPGIIPSNGRTFFITLSYTNLKN